MTRDGDSPAPSVHDFVDPPDRATRDCTSGSPHSAGSGPDCAQAGHHRPDPYPHERTGSSSSTCRYFEDLEAVTSIFPGHYGPLLDFLRRLLISPRTFLLAPGWYPDARCRRSPWRWRDSRGPVARMRRSRQSMSTGSPGRRKDTPSTAANLAIFLNSGWDPDSPAAPARWSAGRRRPARQWRPGWLCFSPSR